MTRLLFTLRVTATADFLLCRRRPSVLELVSWLLPSLLLFQLLVDTLLLLNLSHQVLDRLVLRKQLSLLSCSFLPHSLLINLLFILDHLNPFLEELLFLFQRIDLIDQVYVLFHQPFVDFLMLLMSLLLFCLQLLDVVAQAFAFALKLDRLVARIRYFRLNLFCNILLVELDNLFLKLLVVAYVVKCVMDLFFELLLVLFLYFELLLQLALFTDKPAHSHPEILNDQAEVFLNATEMSLLLLHLVRLLFQFVDCSTSWPDVSPELLNFVVKNELELLKLLCFLL
jgi:hypothetical protein